VLVVYYSLTEKTELVAGWVIKLKDDRFSKKRNKAVFLGIFTIKPLKKVASRNYEFVVNNADTYFKKDELPIFFPSETVEVTVTCNAQGDSTWTFLHHGCGHKPGFGHHIRQPFSRDNTTTFSRTWYIRDDSIINPPAVRHSAIDVLGWETLFGDTSKTYYSRAWCLPYIVKTTDQPIPADTTQ